MSQERCPAPHATLKADRSLWEQLPYLGVTRFEADETGPAEVIEFRNCACGSTLALKVE